MKHLNLKLASILAFSLFSISTFAQAPFYWKLGGNDNNFPSPVNTTNNILGTNINVPLRVATNGINRAYINPNRTQTISGYTFNANGFIGIGQNSVAPTHPNGVWNDFGPFSILHINGFGGSEVKPSGYRPWMQAGVTFTDNNDLSYVGLRKMGTGTERTEMVIAWSDNLNVPGSIGPDDLVFRFLTPGTGNTSFASSLNTTNDIDGRNIARFTPDGKMALGSTFGDPVEFSAFVRPASLLHMSVVGGLEAFLQITQEGVTGQTADDGLRLGIHQQTDNGLLRWQEITPFVVQTDWDAIPGGLGLSNGERLRISSINAPGVPNPSGLDINTTRLAISHIGNLPLTEPRSLIHAGRNTTATGDGWRSWMDVGMFLNNGSDNLFLGLKQEISHQIDRFDAVLNWGDNQTSPGSIGPDNLRFIFTSTLGVGNPPANSANGLETARISPAVATTMGTNYGMMGIGDFSPTGPNTATADVLDAKLDIDGDLRIRTVTQRDTLLQVLVIDTADKNRVHWRSISGLGGSIGNYCPDTPNPLTDNYEIPLNNFNYYFTGNGLPNTNNVSIGAPCSTVIPSKLYVYNDANQHGILSNMNANGTPLAVLISGFRAKPAIRGVSVVNSGTTPGTTVGVVGEAVSNASWGATGIVGYATGTGNNNEAGRFDAVGASQFNNYGIKASASGSNGTNYGVHASAPVAGSNRAGYFVGIAESTSGGILTSDKMFKTNVEDIKGATDVLRKLRPHTYKMDVTKYPQFNFQDRMQYGFIAQEVEFVLPELVHDSYMPSELDSLGNEINPAVSYKSLNYNGLIPITVQAVIELNERLDKATLSDQNVKTNVQNLANSLDKVKQMRGVSYEWSSSAQNDMNLDSLSHIGFIAQEIAAIEPLLTFTDDSSLVHVNYDRVAPLLVESIKELDAKNHVLDSINNDLETRLAYLENCIRNANICTEGNKTTNTEPGNTTNYKSIELTNNSSIILDQNLPNPFAENTVINYNIPAEVSEAKLLFYDLNGRIIKELIIDERGESKLTVYGENLQSGVYTYSLIADGKLIATKKMVKK